MDCAGGRVSHSATHLEVVTKESPTRGRAVEETPVCRTHFGSANDYEKVGDWNVLKIKRKKL